MFQWPTFGLHAPEADRADSERDDQIEQSFPASDPPSTTPQRSRRRMGKHAFQVANNVRALLRRIS